MNWLIIGFMVLIAVCFIILRGIKGPAYSLEMIERPINDLLKRGYNGGFLIIDIHRSKYFLQLKKYIKPFGNYGIELCFPNADWSKQLFIKLEEFCKRTKIEYSIERHSGNLDFLCIDFGRDSKKAFGLIKTIIINIFNLDEGIKIFVKLENATTEDKLIDR